MPFVALKQSVLIIVPVSAVLAPGCAHPFRVWSVYLRKVMVKTAEQTGLRVTYWFDVSTLTFSTISISPFSGPMRNLTSLISSTYFCPPQLLTVGALQIVKSDRLTREPK